MWFLIGLLCLANPVDGPVVADYAPVGAYAGHWGVDFGVAPGTLAKAPIRGTVSFAGSVAGMKTVTIQSEVLKVSVSYLSEVSVARGDQVEAGDPVGRTGMAHDTEAVHLSVRVGGDYMDPALLLRCELRPISDALRLVPYPVAGENRTPGRHFRPASSRSPAHRRGRLSAARPRLRRVRSGRITLAESRS